MEGFDKLRGMLAQQGQKRLRLIGIAASLFWLLLVLLAGWLTPDSQDDGGVLAWLVWLLGVALPLALIWFALHCAQMLDVLRDEAEGLRLALTQMGQGGDSVPDMPVPDMSARNIAAPAPSVPRPAAPAPRRPLPPRVAQVPPVAARAPETAEIPDLSPTELYFALNFPEGPEDHEAIRCLQLALSDPDLARLIRAAQDVITLLAGRGIYMDDLPVPETDAGLWRRFAQGARGQAVAGLAVIDNPNALQVTDGLLSGDEVFRDVAQHFMRRFDRLLVRRAATDDPAVLAVLSETRSGRAFILLAQVSGMLAQPPESAHPESQPEAQQP